MVGWLDGNLRRTESWLRWSGCPLEEALTGQPSFDSSRRLVGDWPLLQRTTILFCLVIVSASGPARGETPSAESARYFPQRILRAHNAVRAEAGVPALSWDDRLGDEAAKYAVQLAMTGRFAHSSSDARGGTGENLWMGTRGAFSVEAMVGSWASEKRIFSAGVFPAVARNGNWHEVGHYTQMIWPTTQRVGCALATNAAADYLVCRYSPAGNVIGSPLLLRYPRSR